MTIFSKNIVFLRNKDGLSQQEFAKKIGVNRGNIDSYERKAYPKPEILVKIANFFGIHLEILLTKNITDSNYNLLVRERKVSQYVDNIEDAELESEILSSPKFRKSIFLELMLKIKYEEDSEARAKLIDKVMIHVSLLEDENSLLAEKISEYFNAE